MAQVTTIATVGPPLSRERLWTTKKHRKERVHAMTKPRRSIRSYVGQKVLDWPTYPIFKTITPSTSRSYGMASQQSRRPRYSVEVGAITAFEALRKPFTDNELPAGFKRHVGNVKFVSPLSEKDGIYFPSPLREQDAIAAIKALEACAAAAIADLRHGDKERAIKVDLDKAACFLMSAYLTTIGGHSKGDPELNELIKDTDLLKAQSILYNRLSAGLYKTRDGKFYHIHGSLNADPVFESLGMASARKDGQDEWNYPTSKAAIAAAVKELTAEELEEKNKEYDLAGIQALGWEDFQETSHGKLVCSLPPFTVSQNTDDPLSTRVDWPETNSDRRVLSGIKVIEMCRIIAGPTIGRSLAAHGASVMKVTPPNLSDVPFFQVDVNTGKYTVDLDLKDTNDKEEFEKLLKEADILIDGYRPGKLEKLGYGEKRLAEIARERRKGFVYVIEDCFGGAGVGAKWALRPGWQQIADCVTGVAWKQGQFMGKKNEPVVPPFPMSDYGTGALGCIAAMMGLYRRATEGGSWTCRTSLCQYDIFLLKLGVLPEDEQKALRAEHDEDFFTLEHNDSVDEVGKRALASMRRVTPHLFDTPHLSGNDRLMQKAWSKGFNQKEGIEIRWPREAIEVTDIAVGHVRPSRNNGADKVKAGWENWEMDKGMLRELKVGE